MAKEIILKVGLEGTEETISNVQKLEQEIEKLNKQKQELLSSPSISTGAFSKQLDDIDSQIGKLEKTYQSATGNAAKFEKAQKNLEGVAKTLSGSINLATATLATFGVKNEEVEKTLLKVQAAASFSQGLKDLQEGFKGLGLTFGGLTKIMLANPFTAIAVAVTALIGYFGGFEAILGVVKNAASALFDTLGSLIGVNKEYKEELISATAAIERYEAALSALDNRYSTEERQLTNRIALLKAQGAPLDEILKAENKLIETRRNNAATLIAENKAVLVGLQAKLKVTTDIKEQEVLNAEIIKAGTALNAARANFDQAKADVDIKNAQDKTDALLKQKDAVDKVKAANEKRIADEKKAADELKKENEKAQADAFNTLVERLKRESAVISEEGKNQIDVLKEQFLEGKISNETFAAEKILVEKDTNSKLIELKDSFQLTDAEKLKIGLDNAKKITEQSQLESIELTRKNLDIEVNLKKTNDDDEKKRAEEIQKLKDDLAKREEENQKRIDAEKKKYAEEEKKRRLEERDAAIQLGADSLSALSTLSNIFFKNKSAKAKGNAKEEEEIARKQFKINKAFQIGQAVINGIQSVLAITSTAVDPTGISTLLRIGSQVALNAASIAQIAATKFEGGGSGGSSAPSAPTPSLNTSGSITPTNFQPTALNTGASQQQTFGGALGNGGGNVLRAYVSETDLSSTQIRLRNIRNASEL